MILIKKLHAGAKVSAQEGSGGLDVHCLTGICINANSHIVVPTGLAIDPSGIVPESLRTKGFIAAIDVKSRSGTSSKAAIEKGAGFIDENYRGELKIVLHNHRNRPYYFSAGEKIAQLTFRVVFNPLKHVFVAELDETNRGGNGFGSTGK